MKTCRALVWESLNNDGRCGKEATCTIADQSYCNDCGSRNINANFDYASQYLNSIILRINDMDMSLLSGKETEIFLLKSSLQNCLDSINKIKNG